MIGAKRPRKPRNFDSTVKARGDAWLAKNPNAKRPKDLWSPYRAQFSAVNNGLCGYAGMLDATGGSIDHFLSFKNYPKESYSWENYRFSSSLMNGIKRNHDDAVFDPLDVHRGWFEILLPSLEMQVSGSVPKSKRKMALETLRRLKLRDDERVIKWRSSWYDLYRDKHLDIDGLEKVAPLIADAERRRLAAMKPPASGQASKSATTIARGTAPGSRKATPKAKATPKTKATPKAKTTPKAKATPKTKATLKAKAKSGRAPRRP